MKTLKLKSYVDAKFSNAGYCQDGYRIAMNHFPKKTTNSSKDLHTDCP